jgi:hypothetical protein
MRTLIIKRISLVLVIIIGLSVIVMLLWNLLVPSIFGIKVINFEQALGLFVLARLLFGSISSRSLLGFSGHSHHNPVREKWMKMTPEERKEFIRDRHHGHGHWQRHDSFGTEKSEKDS